MSKNFTYLHSTRMKFIDRGHHQQGNRVKVLSVWFQIPVPPSAMVSNRCRRLDDRSASEILFTGLRRPIDAGIGKVAWIQHNTSALDQSTPGLRRDILHCVLTGGQAMSEKANTPLI
jgi:hypothetical protein